MSEPKIVSGVKFTSLLAILFIGLKLSGIIHWHWFWVLSPLWLSFVLNIAGAMLMMFIVRIIIKNQTKEIIDKIDKTSRKIEACNKEIDKTRRKIEENNKDKSEPPRFNPN